MDPEQNDINAAVEEAIIEHADAFIAADTAVEEVMVWAEAELVRKEQEITDAGGGAEAFKAAAADIEAEVARRLQALEDGLRSAYPAQDEH